MISKEELKNRIDFSFYCAEESFTKTGNFIPMIDISFLNEKGENQKAFFALMEETLEERMKSVYKYGCIFGNFKNKGKVKDVCDVLFVVEAEGIKNRASLPMIVIHGQTMDKFCVLKAKEIKRSMDDDLGWKTELVEMEDGDGYVATEPNPLLSKFYEGYNNVVKQGIVFKDEDMPLNNSLKEIFKD